MKALVHPIFVLETCTRIIAYLVAWTIRAHRHLVRIESDFIRVPNGYALEAAALRRWSALDNPVAPVLLHFFGGSPHGVHVTTEEMRRWIGIAISGLGIAEGVWALHFSLGGRGDFHFLSTNAVLRGGPLHTQDLLRRLQELAQQATEDLNARRLAAGLLPIGCLTIEGHVYYPDLRVEVIKVPPREPNREVEVPPSIAIEKTPAPPADPGPKQTEPQEPLPPQGETSVTTEETTEKKAPTSSGTATADAGTDTTLGRIPEPREPSKKATPTPEEKSNPNVPAHEWERRIRLLAILAAEADSNESDRERRRREEAEKQVIANVHRWIAEAKSVIDQSTKERHACLHLAQDYTDAIKVADPRVNERRQHREIDPNPRARSESWDR